MHYKILGDSSFSDHHPVSFLINLSNSPPGGSSWKANAGYLQEVKDPIKALWKASLPQMPFLTKLRKVVKFYKQLYIAKANEARIEEARIRKSLELWQVMLHFDPHNEANKSTILDLRTQLQTFMDKKEDGHRIYSLELNEFEIGR